MCSVCKHFFVLSKLPRLMSAEKICNQPKQFQLQMLLRSWLTPAGGGWELAQYLRTLTKAKAKQNTYAGSQELPNSPVVKGTYCSRLPRTWDWVRHSGYHRPDAEVHREYPPKEQIGDQSIHPNRKTKWKQAFLKVGVSISALQWVRKNWGSVTFLTAMGLQHQSSAMQCNCPTNLVATLGIASFPHFLRKGVVDNYIFILERKKLCSLCYFGEKSEPITEWD